jgi:tRNA(Ile)-lysidine synthase
MVFSPASLLTQLMQYPVPRRYCVAYSGGLDSHVLLHALVQLRNTLPCSRLHAVHINHGIHADAAGWAQHCETVCRELGVSFEAITVTLPRQAGHSLEAVAREARYAALRRCSQADDLLLLAHHQDDQAETLLLQLLRGSGVKGLAAMPGCTPFAHGWLARPFLDVARAELHAYAVINQLHWVNDPSNQDTGYVRNFLRHEVMPMLRQRWPTVDTTLARVAQHQAEASALLDVLAQQDLTGISNTPATVINIEGLQRLPSARQRNVVRYWLHQCCQLPLPSTVQLQRILDEALTADADATPLVHWPGAEVRRYRTQLHAMTPIQPIEPGWQYPWDLQAPVALPTGETLVCQAGQGRGLRRDLAHAVTIRFRRGGEYCRLPGRQHRHELKKLFQAWGVPPWQRDRIPLIYIGAELAQVLGYCICAPYSADSGEHGIEIMYQRGQTAIETIPENKDNSPGCTP